jgi:hypothetical protein
MFGSADKNRIAPVSIERKPLYNNRGNASAIQQIVGSLIEPLMEPVLNTVGEEAI